MNKIEGFFGLDARIGFLLIQENRHHEKHAVRVKEEANQRARGRLGTEDYFLIGPTEICGTPGAYPKTDQGPEGLTEAGVICGRPEST